MVPGNIQTLNLNFQAQNLHLLRNPGDAYLQQVWETWTYGLPILIFVLTLKLQFLISLLKPSLQLCSLKGNLVLLVALTTGAVHPPSYLVLSSCFTGGW